MLTLNRLSGFGAGGQRAVADDEPYSGYFDGVIDGVANSSLTRTPGSSSSGQRFTISAWVRRDSASSGAPMIFSAGSSTDAFGVGFNASNQLAVYIVGSGTYVSSSTFSSTSVWYHVTVAIDTTQATAADRVKAWVDGVAQSFSVSVGSLPALNLTTHVNQSTKSQAIGYYVNSGGDPFVGSIADFCLIAGTALDANSFGVSVSGVWSHKNYTGTYGTNGVRIRFNPATLPNDQSGNGNNYTNNGVAPDLRTPTRSATVTFKTTAGETGSITLPSNAECVALLWGPGDGGQGSTAGNPGGSPGAATSTTFNSSGVVAGRGASTVGYDFIKTNSGQSGAGRAGDGGGGGGPTGTGGKGETFFTGSSGSGGDMAWEYFAAGAIGTSPTYRVGSGAAGGGGDAPGGDGGNGQLRVVYR